MEKEFNTNGRIDSSIPAQDYILSSSSSVPQKPHLKSTSVSPIFLYSYIPSSPNPLPYNLQQNNKTLSYNPSLGPDPDPEPNPDVDVGIDLIQNPNPTTMNYNRTKMSL